MTANTKIEWADHTFNPWVGCTKVSPACDHCYAEGWAKRSGMVQWGPHADRRRTSEANWRQPLKWNAEAERLGVVQRVFCASLSDWADKVPLQWHLDLAALINKTRNLIWLLLTKRIGNAAALLAQMFPDGVPDNVWVGSTICNQEEADRDIHKLLAVPAAKRFLSMEPLLGPVDLSVVACLPCPNSVGGLAVDPDTGGHDCCKACDWTGLSSELGIDWVIVGGESGHNARPMHPDWARSLRDQCQAAGVPFLFKQWGEWCPRGPAEWGYPSVDGVPRFRMTDTGANGSDLAADGENHVWMNRAGKKTAGRLLDGREWNEIPAP